MYSISQLARASSLPRRTVQYWHDRGVILPLNPAPVVYDDKELVLVRILAAMAHLRPALPALQELSRIIRLCISEDDSVTAETLRGFREAKRGREAYFLVSPSTHSDMETMWVWTRCPTSQIELMNDLLPMVVTRPELGVVVINLTYCYRTDLHSGVLYFEDDNA